MISVHVKEHQMLESLELFVNFASLLGAVETKKVKRSGLFCLFYPSLLSVCEFCILAR